MIYLNELAVLALVYLVLALSSVVLVQYSGLLSFLPAAIFGSVVFLYPQAFALMHSHLVALVFLVGALLLGLLIALSVYKYDTDFLAVLTFGLIAGYTALPIKATADLPLAETLLVILGIAVLLFFLLKHLLHAPFGLSLLSMKKNLKAAELLGRNTGKLKLTAVLLSSFLAASAGIIFALSYTSSWGFNPFAMSIMLIALAVLNGLNLWGLVLTVLAAAVLPEFLALTGMGIGQVSAAKQVVYSIIILLTLFLKPKGMFSSERLKVKTPPAKKEKAREKAERIAKERAIAKSVRHEPREPEDAMAEIEHTIRSKEKRQKSAERKKLEKTLLREQKRRQEELSAIKRFEELDHFESHIKRMELKKEIERERLLSGEGVFIKGFRLFKNQGEKLAARLKKKR